MAFWKHPQYGHVYGEAIATPTARALWPSLAVAREFKGDRAQNADGKPDAPRFQNTFGIDPSTKEAQDFFAAIKTQADELMRIFNEKRPAPIGSYQLAQDGSSMDKEKYPFCQGLYLVASNLTEDKVKGTKPKVLDENLQPLDPSAIEGGMFVRGIIIPMFTTHGLKYKLDTVQRVGDDGKRFAGGQRDLTNLLSAIGGAVQSVAPRVSLDGIGVSVEQNILLAPTPEVLPPLTQAVRPAQDQRAAMTAQVQANRSKGKQAVLDKL